MRCDNDRAEATITWISGPVLRARTLGSFQVNEAVLVGPQRLLGDVIRINGDEAVIQVYEDTTGLRPGTPLSGTATPLSVRLGPGLLGNIFDGLLRPLTVQGHYVAPGISNSLDTNKWPFRPRARVGEQLAVPDAARPPRDDLAARERGCDALVDHRHVEDGLGQLAAVVDDRRGDLLAPLGQPGIPR